MKDQIERIKAISKTSEAGIIIDGSEAVCLQDLDDVVIFVTILFLIFKEPKTPLKVRMGKQYYEKIFLRNTKRKSGNYSGDIILN